jgi:hypothetical protein
MKKASAYLAAIGGTTLFALAPVVPALADPGSYLGNAHWRHHGGPDVIFGVGPRRYFRVGPRRHFGEGRRYFGDDPGRYFGVGPGSYECYGYDCIW